MSGIAPAILAAVLGAIVGSFLNACIHRMPRGIRLGNPRRSFCPACQKLIPWHENLPVLSWLVLRGRCSGCGTRISIRYPLVELLTAGLFFTTWTTYGLPLAPVYGLFLGLMIAATFIDIEHFIIPDEITWGGAAAGVLLSGLVPALMGVAGRFEAMGRSVFGAALGFGILWLVVEGGKLAFGRKSHKFQAGESFEWRRDGDRADLRIGEESLRWEDIFGRESDVMILRCESLNVDGQESPGGEVRFRYDRLIREGIETPLDTLGVISGRLTSVTIPREAMGFGDVKFIAAIGAFLGWQAVIFTVFAASVIGCVAGLAGIFLARDRSGARIPFGPFLALGATGWLFGGQRLFDWYFSLFNRQPPF